MVYDPCVLLSKSIPLLLTQRGQDCVEYNWHKISQTTPEAIWISTSPMECQRQSDTSPPVSPPVIFKRLMNRRDVDRAHKKTTQTGKSKDLLRINVFAMPLSNVCINPTFTFNSSVVSGVVISNVCLSNSYGTPTLFWIIVFALLTSQKS